MDTDAEFTAYVRARRAQLFRTACVLCGNPDLAEDVVQDTLAGQVTAVDHAPDASWLPLPSY